MAIDLEGCVARYNGSGTPTGLNRINGLDELGSAFDGIRALLIMLQPNQIYVQYSNRGPRQKIISLESSLDSPSVTQQSSHCNN